MNFPKFLFRKNQKAISESSEQPDADDSRRSESSFSIVSRPSTSHSTHDLNGEVSPRTSGNQSEEADRAYNEAAALLSRYKDFFNDNSDFRQLEERWRKLPSTLSGHAPGKLIKSTKKLKLNGLGRTNSEKYRTEAESLLRDIQFTIGNLNAVNAAVHKPVPLAERSSSDPLPLNQTENPLQRNGTERRGSVRRHRSNDIHETEPTRAASRPLPIVHEEGHPSASRDRDGDRDEDRYRSRRYDERRYKERDRAGDRDRERDRDKPRERERERERERGKSRDYEESEGRRRRSHSDTNWDEDRRHRYYGHKREPRGSLDEYSGRERDRYDDRERRDRDRDRDREKDGGGERDKERDRERDRDRGGDRERERDRDRDRDRDRERRRERERDRRDRDGEWPREDRDRDQHQKGRDRDKERYKDRDRERRRDGDEHKDRQRDRDRYREHERHEVINIQIDRGSDENLQRTQGGTGDEGDREQFPIPQEGGWVEEQLPSEPVKDGRLEPETVREETEEAVEVGPSRDKGKGKAKEVDRHDHEGENPSAPEHNTHKEREKRRDRRDRRDRDDYRSQHDRHDAKYSGEKYARSIARDQYADKYQTHKRSHSHSGYPYGHYERYRLKEHERYASRDTRNDDDRYRDRDKERYQYRDNTEKNKDKTTSRGDHPAPRTGDHEANHIGRRGSDSESILMIPPPGWRTQQRHNQERPVRMESRPMPVTVQPVHMMSPPAPPTVIDYPTSVHRASMAVVLPSARTAVNRLGTDIRPGTHWNPEVIRNRDQTTKAQEQRTAKNKEPQNSEPPIVWNQASLAATVREQQKKRGFRLPWLPTPKGHAGSRLLEVFSPQVAKGQKRSLPAGG